MDILFILQLIIKLFLVLKLFIRPQTCFGVFYAIVRGFVIENQVLFCIGSYVFCLSVAVNTALFSLLPSWLVYDEAFYDIREFYEKSTSL
jgi:hypothetical protein